MSTDQTKSALDHRISATADRRREVRYPCRDTAEIRSLDEVGPTHDATVLDISKSGLRLEARVHFPKGSHVEVLLHTHAVILGAVRHCRAVGSGYHVGILIEEVFYSHQRADHIPDEMLKSYFAGQGLTWSEVLTVSQHVRMCQMCSTRLENAMGVSESVGRGRVPKR